MASSLDHAKEWMRDGDRLLERASRRLGGAGLDQSSLDVQMAAHDFSRAAQMYLTGAVEYQQGTEALQRATAGLDDTVRLVQYLEGRLRSEAEAAWQSARQELLRNQQVLGSSPSAGSRSLRVAREILPLFATCVR